MRDVVACRRKCWGCMFDDHDTNWHSWAGCDERGLPLAPGQVDPFAEQCGCYCQNGVVQ